MRSSCLARLRLPAVALLAFACAVYEPPTDGNTSGGGSSAAGAVAGGSASGSSGSDAGGASGNGGGAPSSAGSSVGGSPAAAGAGAGGEPVVAPEGGAGGSPVVPDDCPQDPDKLEPGTCGCGIPEAPAAELDDCMTLKSLLVHRYDFEGSGTAVEDRIGSANGVVRGATVSKVDGRGVVLLGGGSAGAYVDLPNGLLSSLTSATIEAWVTWGGGSPWQRIFDFGDSTHQTPEDNPANGKSYLFVTPESSTGVARVAFSLAGNSPAQEVQADAGTALAQTLSQVVVVADSVANQLLLYIDGVEAGAQVWTQELADINDVNVWLGRSQYAGDAELSGVFHELRVYDAALSASQVASAFRAGTDPAFLAP